ncbi:MAG TPA: ATP synthase F1 subunit delta [Flavisolibacter sp.]|jgi:F-type H+-transporting ATPase subunit delta|nr:ATP synthase F1 subunit delta [Flavisolibacter sp.]
MLNPRVASRYAKSLLDLALEKGQLEQVHTDMQYLQQLTKGSREFLKLLRSPVVKADVKNKAVDAVTSGKIGELTKAFTHLLINKAREAVLPEVITSFIQQYKHHKNIQTVKLTTAVPVTDQLRNAIIEQVKKTSDLQTIELETAVDPSLIGGFVLQAGDKLVDASIAYDLKEISKQFENNDFIYKVR